MRLSVPRLLLFACALLAVLPAGANAASSKKGAGYPVIKKVSPLKLSIGGTLTITGKNFRSGKGKNTVVFKRSGKPAVFAKSASSTTTKITVVVPAKLSTFLSKKNGTAVGTRFQLRVLAKRFSKAFTSNSLSPVISPKKAGGAGGGTPPTPYQMCQAGLKANPGADSDADGLVNATETAIGTDPCNADSDGDGMVDGYEYDSALDLNGRALPYPGKRPWPNPLDPSDGNNDFDGDGLSLVQEYKLWKFVGGTFPVTAYSDGTQNSGGKIQAIGGLALLDLDGDGYLTDDERDADNDGLSNIVEYQFRGTQAWWNEIYDSEKPYGARIFSGVDPTVWDSDGDGVGDGADDQDEDGYSNYQEMEVSRGQSPYLRVQPYNPCLPEPYSPTCSRYVPKNNAWPPFDGSQKAGDPIPFTTNGSSPPNWGGRVWDGHSGGPQGA
jgi:IPT/TIG domain-containing protein